MRLRIPQAEHVVDDRVPEQPVPGRLHVVAADAVDGAEGGERREVDLGGRDAHDGAVALVERVDVVQAAAAERGEFERDVRERGVPRAGDVAEGREVGGAEGLWASVSLRRSRLIARRARLRGVEFLGRPYLDYLKENKKYSD